MNSKTFIIIQREFVQRVSKKSFLITTILMPLIMLALMVVPVLLMELSESENRTILVIDRSGQVASELKNTSELTFSPTALALDSARKVEDVYAVLVIPENAPSGQGVMQLYSNEATSMNVESAITRQINDIVEQKKLQSQNIENLKEIIESVQSNLSLQSIRNDDSSEVSSTMSYLLGLALTMMLYMCLLIYGQMVMTSIIEEKNNRVIELVVSSVKPTQLMMGKICGIGLVAVTQIVIWGVLIGLMSAFLLPAIMPQELASELAMFNSGAVDPASLTTDTELLQIISMMSNVSYLLSLFGLLLLFLVGGFMLYSAIYAAIGSAVDNIQDASQLQSVIVFPIIIGMVLATTAGYDPSSPLAFWTSLIPFTSPMVMMARIPFGIPAWEIVVSLVLLFLTFLFTVWCAAKIYRVGIFMYGKKPSVKELVKWMKYSN